MIELPPHLHRSLRETVQSWREIESYRDLLSPATHRDQQEAPVICVLKGLLSGLSVNRDRIRAVTKKRPLNFPKEEGGRRKEEMLLGLFQEIATIDDAA